MLGRMSFLPMRIGGNGHTIPQIFQFVCFQACFGVSVRSAGVREPHIPTISLIESRLATSVSE